MKKPKIGLALGSGGARGWCHIGVLRALAGEGIEPDVVAGCSMGALVGAAYVAGALDALEEWAYTLNWRKAAGFLDVNLASGGLIQGKRIVAFLNSILEDAPIESFKKPFMTIASDMQTGREIWLDKGSTIDAVRASIALPGIISPVNLGGKWLLDGGVTNPVPVSACRAMGAEIIIAINPNANTLEPHVRLGRARVAKERGKPRSALLNKMLGRVPDGIKEGLKTVTPNIFGPKAGGVPRYIEVVAASVEIMTSQILRARMAGEPPHVMINPYLAHMTVLEFYRAKEAIEEGRRAAQAVMPMIREYLP
jgi:NTE family protein